MNVGRDLQLRSGFWYTLKKMGDVIEVDLIEYLDGSLGPAILVDLKSEKRCARQADQSRKPPLEVRIDQTETLMELGSSDRTLRSLLNMTSVGFAN